MIRKIGQCFLALLVLNLNIASAGVMDDFWNGMKKGWNETQSAQFFNDRAWSNYSKAMVQQQGNSFGGSYFGASGSFRFSDTASTYKPFLDWEAPSIEADCNGLSYSLGFASLIDFEDIGANLGNVAGALTFGIIVAIINSLPTINQAFTQIKALVQYIQNLLRNACNFSKNIVGGLIHQAQTNARDEANQPDASLGMKVANAFVNSQDYVNSASNIVNKTLTEFTNDIDKNLKGLTGNASSSGKKISSEFEQVASAFYKVGYFPSVLLPYLLPEADVLAKKVVPLSQELIGVDDNFSLSSPKTFYLLAVNIVGDPEGLSTTALKDLMFSKNGKTIVDFYNALIHDGKVDGSFNDIIKYYGAEKYAQDRGDVKLAPPAPNVYVGGKSATLLRDVLYGDNKKIRIYSQRVVFAQTISKNNKIYQMLKTLPDTDDNYKDVDWEGLIVESEKAIYCIMDKRYPNSKVADLLKGNLNTNCSNGINQSPTNQDFYLIAPDWHDRMNTIVELGLTYLKGDSIPKPEVYRERAKSLVKILALENAIYYTSYLMENIQDVYKKKSAETNTTTARDRLMKELEIYKAQQIKTLKGELDNVLKSEELYQRAVKEVKAKEAQRQ